MAMQTIILAGNEQRRFAVMAVKSAAYGSIVTVREPGRTLPQNAHMWALLTDLSTQCPEGRVHSPNVWKALCMHALGHETEWIEGIGKSPLFPIGLRSSKLDKAEMAALIDFIYAYGAEHGVQFHVPKSMEPPS